MALSAKALVTVANTEIRLDITAGTETAKLELLIEAATALVEKYCGRNFKEDQYTEELYDGQDTNRFFLRDYPVSDAVGDAPVVLVDDVEVEIDAINYRTGRVDLVSVVNKETGNIKATYKAGYADADIPFDLKETIYLLVARSRNVGKNTGISSESVGEYSVTYASDRINGVFTPDIRQRLINYRRY